MKNPLGARDKIYVNNLYSNDFKFVTNNRLITIFLYR